MPAIQPESGTDADDFSPAAAAYLAALALIEAGLAAMCEVPMVRLSDGELLRAMLRTHTLRDRPMRPRLLPFARPTCAQFAKLLAPDRLQRGSLAPAECARRRLAAGCAWPTRRVPRAALVPLSMRARFPSITQRLSAVQLQPCPTVSLLRWSAKPKTLCWPTR